MRNCPGLRSNSASLSRGNTGEANHDNHIHDQAAQRLFYFDHVQAFLRKLMIPILIPVFPRVPSIYTHALTRNAMELTSGPMKRLDMQLVAMVKDVIDGFREKGLFIADKILMNGYSASSKFVTRFALMHPEKVQAVAAGGVNGLLTLPIDRLSDVELRYPIGIADLNDLINKNFNFEVYSKVSQFIYMGTEDTNDSVPYLDSYSTEDNGHIKL